MLERHSSRRTPLNRFLADALDGAAAYDRIAGYFSSSVLEVALSREQEAKKLIEAVSTAHPFELRYDKIETVDWESCATPLAEEPQLEALWKGWS